MRMKLNIATTLTLPVEALTRTFMLLGQRGTGKTSLGVVMTEEFSTASLPFVVVDPLGVWWGLRASLDGKGEGLAVLIFGGEHGDVPLEPTAGAVVADVIVENPGAYVLDLSLMRKGQRLHFMADFGERLYDAKASQRSPLHLMIDEADEFAPQLARGDGGMAPKVLGAMEDLIRRGRSRGIGMTCITQRPAVLNKNVLSQADTLAVFRLSAPQDRKAIDDWVREHATKEQLVAFDENLHQLDPGNAFFWSPSWLKTFKKVHVRQRETFDSSATPEVGVAARAPKVMAKVDVEAVKARIAATVDAKKAEDPKTLRAHIAELEAQLASRKEVVTRVEVPVLPPEMRDQLVSIIDDFRPLLSDFTKLVTEVTAALARVDGKVGFVPPRPTPKVVPIVHQPAAHVWPKARPNDGDSPALGKCERAVLRVLAARDPQPTTLAQVAVLSGYSAASSSLANALGKLRSSGLATAGQPLRLTPAGKAAAGPVEPLPTGRALLDHWLGQLGQAERAFLMAIYDAHPRELTRERLAELAGYSPTSSSFGNALGRLRRLELVEKNAFRLGQALAEAK